MHEMPIFLSLSDQYLKLRNGDLTATQLAETSIDNYTSYETTDNAYLTWCGDQALKSAGYIDKLFEARKDAGMLMGIPVSIKDIYAVPGLPTYAGSSQRLPTEWEQAGPIVEKLLSQIPSMMGKTHSVEFGTAALALGTDTAGSVRIPASMTGVAGFKTTAGRWSTNKIVPLSSTLDTPGLLARSVDDIAFAFSSLDDHASKRGLYSKEIPNIQSLTFGVPEKYFWDNCRADIAETVHNAIKMIESAGATIKTFDIPNTDEAYQLLVEGGLSAAELLAFLTLELPKAIDNLDPKIAMRLESAREMSAVEYIRRIKLLNKFKNDAERSLQNIDALIMPTLVNTPPVLDDIIDNDSYMSANFNVLQNTCIANFMGLCGLTMPVGKDNNGMPIGLQMLAAPWKDNELIASGRSVERVIGNSLQLLGEPPRK